MGAMEGHMMVSSLNTPIAATPRVSRRTVDAPTRMFHWLLAGCLVVWSVTSSMPIIKPLPRI